LPAACSTREQLEPIPDAKAAGTYLKQGAAPWQAGRQLIPPGNGWVVPLPLGGSMAPTQVSGSLNYSNSKGTEILTTKKKVAEGINHTYGNLDQSITAKQRN
jgi:hypothetical protein